MFDRDGLYLEVTPAGGKVFRLKYRIDGKEKTFTIGKYPTVSLVEARQAAENACRLLASGQDPVKPSNKKSVNGKPLSVIPFGTLPPSGINTVKQD
ncbi:Arm DNA-binding domain-containing protein [Neisseria mucosa]|uniref:Arm DNA-binding domain-containing protein n=1 Tax=Neisseria mucosa TaxID=488 RepID=UPI0027DF9561|nr:Arm DNA-binding domain-containing protein [Neisseria mucosa]